MKNFLKFLAIDAAFCIAMAIIMLIAYGGKAITPDVYTSEGNPKRYEIVDAYHQYGTDSELEAIDAHYISIDGDPDAYGVILMDNENENYEFSIDVYKDNGGAFIYEWNPYTGDETKKYLNSWQSKWIIKL